MIYQHSTGLFKSEQPEILDQTQSGKEILSSTGSSYSEAYSNQDHLDAKRAHELAADHHDSIARVGMAGKMFNHRAIARAQEQASFHRKQADWHNQQVDKPEEEEVEKSMKKKFRQKLKGGLADSKNPDDFPEESIQEGIKVEMEHTDDPDTAKEIAMDHLEEHPDYYKELRIAEAKMKKGYSPDLTSNDTEFLENHPKEKKRLFRDKLAKKQGVPTGVDPDKHERCVRDVKAQGHDKSSAFAICNASIKKAFREVLLKGGPGSGKKGHQTFKPRKPYPGEEQHKLGEADQKPGKTHVPSGGWQPHYSDTPQMGAYKKFVSHLKRQNKDFMGHISFDPEQGHITAISDQGKALIQEAKDQIAATKKPEQKTNPDEIDLTPKEYWNPSEKDKAAYNKKKSGGK